MLTAEETSFYSQWLNGYDQLSGEDLSSMFSRYINLFIRYNFLYKRAADHLNHTVYYNDKYVKDGESAVDAVVEYLQPSILFSLLTQTQELKTCCDQMDQILDVKMYHISFSQNGIHQPNKDAALLKDLRSGKDQKYVKAVLTFLYRVRCNMFHGSKAFSEHQKFLLGTCTPILKSIVELLYNELSNHQP
jgi:hypothetical protein